MLVFLLPCSAVQWMSNSHSSFLHHEVPRAHKIHRLYEKGWKWGVMFTCKSSKGMRRENNDILWSLFCLTRKLAKVDTRIRWGVHVLEDAGSRVETLRCIANALIESKGTIECQPHTISKRNHEAMEWKWLNVLQSMGRYELPIATQQ